MARTKLGLSLLNTNIVQATTTNQQTVTSSTATAVTGMSASITPSSTSTRIKITVWFTITTSVSGVIAYATLKRGSTELSGVQGFQKEQNNSGTLITYPFGFSYIDSPASTSSQTYQLFINNSDNSSSVGFNRNSESLCGIILEEVN